MYILSVFVFFMFYSFVNAIKERRVSSFTFMYVYTTKMYAILIKPQIT